MLKWKRKAEDMIIADKISDYRVLDTGDGMKLENWGGYLLARPDPQVIWKKSRPALWGKAHAVYHRSATGGTFAHSAASQANGLRRAGALAAARFPHRHSAAGGSCHAAAARAAAHLA